MGPSKGVRVMDAEKIIKRGFILKSEREEVMKDDNFSKVNLVDSEGDSEGIWISIIKGKEHYDNNNSSGDTIYGVLANHALCFFPNPTWGRVIHFKTNGNQRPTSCSSEQIDRLKSTHEAYLQEWPQEEEDE